MKEIHITPWFERTFPPVSNLLFPILLERLEGTPARLREKTKEVSPIMLTYKNGENWSIQEHIGHLMDLELLWIGRIMDITQNLEFLREADLSNQKTHLAGHNDRPLNEILTEFEGYRKQMMDALSTIQEEDMEKSALHPRLKTPMHLIDLMHFVAEHDDHHLAFLSKLKQRQSLKK